MNQQKIKVQKIAALVLLACAIIIFLTAIISKTGSNTSTGMGLLFLAIGAITLNRVRKMEEDLKNKE